MKVAKVRESEEKALKMTMLVVGAVEGVALV